MADTLVNKVANARLITLKLEEHWPTAPFAPLDIKDWLYMELMLKENNNITLTLV